MCVALGQVLVQETAQLQCTSPPPPSQMRLLPSSSPIHSWTRLCHQWMAGHASQELRAGTSTHTQTHTKIHSTMHVTSNRTADRLLQQAGKCLLGITTLSPSHLSLAIFFQTVYSSPSNFFCPSLCLFLSHSVAHSPSHICLRLSWETPCLNTTQE